MDYWLIRRANIFLALVLAKCSRRAAVYGRAQLLAKSGSIGHMQTPAELVPVRNSPQCGVKAL